MLSNNLFSQELNLEEIINLFENRGFDYINDFLTNKGWRDSSSIEYDEKYDGWGDKTLIPKERKFFWSFSNAYGVEVASLYYGITYKSDYRTHTKKDIKTIFYTSSDVYIFISLKNQLKSSDFKFVSESISSWKVLENDRYRIGLILPFSVLSSSLGGGRLDISEIVQKRKKK